MPEVTFAAGCRYQLHAANVSPVNQADFTLAAQVHAHQDQLISAHIIHDNIQVNMKPAHKSAAAGGKNRMW